MRLASLLAACLTAAVVTTTPVVALASPAPEPRTPSADNPLAAGPWGVFKGGAEMAWPPYERATGEEKRLLGTIALTPKAKWFGNWISEADISRKVTEYVENSQAGDPETLVQMTVFRMNPWEHDACDRLPTAKEKASYRLWIDRFAAAVGDTRSAIILQPDGPFAACAPGGSLAHSRLLAYSSRVLAALPRAAVYLDAGAADWPYGDKGVQETLDFIIPGGVEHLRGVALNSTHYSATSLEVARGAAIVEALAARGIPGKHFVVNTSSNGHPFPFGKYTGPDKNNAAVCKTKNEPASRTCVTLGIPPTADVASPRWGLSAKTRRLAAKYADAYLWFGRPWLYRQTSPFVKSRALALVRSTPF